MPLLCVALPYQNPAQKQFNVVIIRYFLSSCPIQVLFVAFGRLMYLGPPDGVVPWFSGRLAFPYHPATDGLPCDWVMDLVSPDMALARKVCSGVRLIRPLRLRYVVCLGPYGSYEELQLPRVVR